MKVTPSVINPVFSGLSLALFALLFFLAMANDVSFLKFLDPKIVDIRIIVMLLLAEPHFAMTIPLLWGYREFFTTERVYFIYIPLLIIIGSSLLFYIDTAIFSYLFLLANIYHVNRQSRGFLLIQGKVTLDVAKFYEFSLHTFFLLVFLSRIYLPINAVILTGVAFVIILGLSMAIWYLQKNTKPSLFQMLVVLQGYFIFLPVVFFEDLLLAFAVGISIHYIQYLAISFPVCRKSFGYSLMPICIFLLGYSILSNASLSGFFTFEKLSVIILIPTTLQLLHFYFDGFIWKKSNVIVRQTLEKANL